MSQRELVFEQITNGKSKSKKKIDLDEINYRLDEPLNIISGKLFFNSLSEWTRKEYGVSISARQVVPYFYQAEVPVEIKSVTEAIMQGRSFKNINKD